MKQMKINVFEQIDKKIANDITRTIMMQNILIYKVKKINIIMVFNIMRYKE